MPHCRARSKVRPIELAPGGVFHAEEGSPFFLFSGPGMPEIPGEKHGEISGRTRPRDGKSGESFREWGKPQKFEPKAPHSVPSLESLSS